MDNVKFCKNCGKVIVDGKKFCTNCGAPVQDDNTANTTSSGTPATFTQTNTRAVKSSSNSGYDIAGFIMGILSVVLGGLLFAILGIVFSSKNKDTNKLAKAGYILSIIGIFVSIIYIVLTVVLNLMR